MSTRTAADLAILGAAIRTLDPDRPSVEALAIREGMLIGVGSEAEVRELCDGRTELLDGRGTALVPGLVDAHIHPFRAEPSSGADLTSCRTLAEVEIALSAERARAGDDVWIRGWGAEYGVFAGREIDHREIDRAAGRGPALISFMDTHTTLANQRALELAGIDGPVRFEENAEVVVRDGKPTGELREWAAMALVGKLVPPLSEATSDAAIAAIQRRLVAAGLTGVHAMDGTPGTFALLRRLESRRQLLTRALVPLWQEPETPEEETARRLGMRSERGQLWRGGVAKFFIDGVIDTGTGWLCEPDTHGEGTEPLWPDVERYVETVARFTEAGFQCVTHATGDGGVRAALDAYREAGAPVGAMHRIEHIETLQDADLPRFAAEGVAASMQPLHMQWRSADGSDTFAERLGPERVARAWRVADLIASGAVVPLGSDWVVAGYDPREGMAWARLRRRPGEIDAPTFEPEQRITGLQALEGYTVAAARVAGEQDFAGRIRPGYRADLTGFAADPVDCPADELPELPVTITVVDGRVVHRA